MTYQPLGDFGDLSVSIVVSNPPWYANCYLVRHRPTGDLVVVDPGDAAEGILAAIEAEGGTPREIWLTHGHPDHICGAKAIEAAFGISTRVHSEDVAVVNRASEINRSFTGQGVDIPGDLKPFEGEPTLTLAGMPVRVIHTPGHTPGAVCYDFGEFALTGDTLFRQGVGRTDWEGGCHDTLKQSITRFLGMMANDTALFSGHGPGWAARDAKRWWQMMR